MKNSIINLKIMSVAVEVLGGLCTFAGSEITGIGILSATLNQASAKELVIAGCTILGAGIFMQPTAKTLRKKYFANNHVSENNLFL